MLLPAVLGIISLGMDGIKVLNIISAIFSIFSLVYFIYCGKSQELYKEWGEKYLNLYNDIEFYYKSNSHYNESKIQEFHQRRAQLNLEKKPDCHICIKNWVEKTIDKEMKHANELKPWYR